MSSNLKLNLKCDFNCLFPPVLQIEMTIGVQNVLWQNKIPIRIDIQLF